MHHSLLPRLAMLAAAALLAGCQAPSAERSRADAAAQTQTEQVPVELFLARAQPSAGLMAVKVPDGTLYLERRAALTREHLSEAAALTDPQGQAFLGLRFNTAGAERLREVTAANQGNLLALVIDRELVTAPAIVEPLDRGVLTLVMPDVRTASELAARIRGGAAPAPVPR